MLTVFDNNSSRFKGGDLNYRNRLGPYLNNERCSERTPALACKHRRPPTQRYHNESGRYYNDIRSPIFDNRPTATRTAARKGELKTITYPLSLGFGEVSCLVRQEYYRNRIA